MDPQPTRLSLHHQLCDPQHGCAATVGQAHLCAVDGAENRSSQTETTQTMRGETNRDENNWTLPGSQIQACLSHWSEQRLWAGHGEEIQGFPTLQPVSTLTVRVGRGRGGASGRTPNRTPWQQKQRSALTNNKH